MWLVDAELDGWCGTFAIILASGLLCLTLVNFCKFFPRLGVVRFALGISSSKSSVVVLSWFPVLGGSFDLLLLPLLCSPCPFSLCGVRFRFLWTASACAMVFQDVFWAYDGLASFAVVVGDLVRDGSGVLGKISLDFLSTQISVGTDLGFSPVCLFKRASFCLCSFQPCSV